eukprot:2582881-Pleurochrysis_carterae.AAC.2
MCSKSALPSKGRLRVTWATRGNGKGHERNHTQTISQVEVIKKCCGQKPQVIQISSQNLCQVTSRCDGVQRTPCNVTLGDAVRRTPRNAG